MINRVHEGQHSNTVVLVTCLLTSVIQDQEPLAYIVLQLKMSKICPILRATKHSQLCMTTVS